MSRTPQLLSRREAAAFVRALTGAPCGVAVLARLASVGGGPPYYRVAGITLYPRSDLRRWAARRRTPLIAKANEAPHQPIS